MPPPVTAVAGRGNPRPLLAGVFRKACDYCVRSKRGCNGGKPCEQCIRRGQSCAYSQRRKSGPRGRPLRQQQAVSTPTSPSPARPVGTRTSSRRRTKRTCPTPSAAVSPASSPSRTASMSSNFSSSSSLSDSSGDEEGDVDDRDAFSDDSGIETEQKQKKKQKQHMHKRSKISRPFAQVSAPAAPAGSPPVSGKGDNHPAASLRIRGGPAAAAAAAAAATEDVPEPQDDEMLLKLTASSSSLSSSSSSSSCSPSPSFLGDEAASYVSKNRIMLTTANKTAPPRQHSPLTVGAPPLPLHLQRSSSLPTWAREASTDAQQQRQPQVHRSSASVGAVPTSSGSSGSSGSDISARFGEISMQLLEISSSSSSSLPSRSADTADTDTADRRRRSVLINMATQQQQQQQQAQAHQAPAFAVTRGRVFTSNHSLPPADPMDDDVPPQQSSSAAAAAAAAPTATLTASMILDGGDFGGGGSAVIDLEEDDCSQCPWQIPSLTREMSLARVVAALGEGGEQCASSHGVGLEGSSSVNGW